MSRRDELNEYIGQVQQRLRLGAGVRGAALVAAVALVATVALTLMLNAYAFAEGGIAPARIALLAVMMAAIGFGVAWPLLRISKARSIARAEATFPELEQRLVTFSERDHTGDPFIELLAADTLSVAERAPVAGLVPQQRLLVLLGVVLACVGVLVWMVAAGPGFVGYGASLLWTGPKKNVAPLYAIHVLPGDAAVRRNSDALVTAQVVGVETSKVTLFARYGSASKWEPVSMTAAEGGAGYQFLFTGLPESVEYYVTAGPVQSKHFNFRVVDLPGVKNIEVTYHYPKWTGMQQVSEEHSGDLRALEGTDAELTVVMDAPLKDGQLMLEGKAVKLTGGEGNRYRGTIHMEKDGAYHVAAVDGGQPVRLSEDYFISTNKAAPPEIAIDRPGADYRASPIEEVTIGVRAGAEFGLRQTELHYSVNGGPEKTVSLLKAPGAKNEKASATLNLEDFKMVPGDVVSLYATAKDAHTEARTEISFIQADPFEREFSQSQQGGGGGGGGGGGQQAGSQTDISRREKELIAATWKQQNDKTATEKQASDMGKVLSEAQVKLREQVLALSGRMQSRDLAAANEEFNSFEKDMQQAAAAMVPSADKLKAQAWRDAMPNEQKALQALLRAEATFRKIQVAFGQQGGGGGGGGGSAGRDLASLFDLELDTEKNQYETAQTGSPEQEKAKKVDDALAKLDALAKRQEELAQQQGNKAQTFQQRWQQEMLRREAEQLQREMEQMQQQGQQSASGQSGQGKAGQQGKSGGQGSQSAQGGSDTKDGGADPRVQQALNRLRAANEEMKRAGGQGQGGQSQSGQGKAGQAAGGGSQSAEQARRAAEELRAATDLLGGAQRQQSTGKLDSLAKEAGRLAREESGQAQRIQQLAGQPGANTDFSAEAAAARARDRNRLADDRQKLSDDLGRLEKGLRDTARSMAPTQPGTSGKLRDALGEMDQADLGNRVQRTADWLRRGVNPNSNGTEAGIAEGLKKLNDSVRQAQQGSGRDGSEGKGSQGRTPGTQTAALDHVERLRSQIERLGGGQGQGQRQGSNGQGQQGQGKQGQAGQQGQGQQGQGQQGQGQQGQGQGQQGQGQQGQQGGQAQGGGRGQAGQGPQQGQVQGGQGNAQGGGQRGVQGGARDGDVGGAVTRGGGGAGGVAGYNVNTGNNTFGGTGRRPGEPQSGTNSGDTQQTIRQGMEELTQLRALAKNDPAALKEIQDLVNEMQKLDPSRFPGNPAMVEELHAQVLHDVDKLELRLRRNGDETQPGQVRTSKTPAVAAGYQDAVAEYYRRLGKAR